MKISEYHWRAYIRTLRKEEESAERPIDWSLLPKHIGKQYRTVGISHFLMAEQVQAQSWEAYQRQNEILVRLR